MRIIATRKAKGYYTHTYVFGEAITSVRTKEIETAVGAGKSKDIAKPVIAGLASLIPVSLFSLTDMEIEMEIEARIVIPDNVRVFLVRWTRPTGEWKTPQEMAMLPGEVVSEKSWAFGDGVDEEEIIDFLYQYGKIMNDPDIGVMCWLYKFRDGGMDLLFSHSLTASEDDEERLRTDIKEWNSRIYRAGT